MIYYACGICGYSEGTLYKKGGDYVCEDHRDQEPEEGSSRIDTSVTKLEVDK